MFIYFQTIFGSKGEIISETITTTTNTVRTYETRSKSKAAKRD